MEHQQPNSLNIPMHLFFHLKDTKLTTSYNLMYKAEGLVLLLDTIDATRVEFYRLAHWFMQIKDTGFTSLLETRLILFYIC